MNSASHFKRLLFWERSHEFVMMVYKDSKFFPREEKYGLTSQFRRAAISIPANIAEGFKKRSQKDKLRFLNIAQGSIEECRYYIILATDLGYLNKENVLNESLEEVSKMLNAYAKKLT